MKTLSLVVNCIVALPDGSFIDCRIHTSPLPDDSYTFFVCNPAEEWLWSERITNFPISEKIAQCLLAHHAGCTDWPSA